MSIERKEEIVLSTNRASYVVYGKASKRREILSGDIVSELCLIVEMIGYYTSQVGR